ncbi:MAG: hypothetical protein NZM38_05500 [Cytophagales bacterium]|nr:hypothetical protein [Cytophagales bacterium]MDW8384209.1 hypothetical protein [Flammeovirgaceae bacterium]
MVMRLPFEVQLWELELSMLFLILGFWAVTYPAANFYYVWKKGQG